MSVHYNRIAGQNLERLAALSDGVFAIAMTLLVLDLKVPVSNAGLAIVSDPQLLQALIPLWPRMLTYLMSFLTMGIYWVAQQTQLNYFARGDRTLTWIHLGFLLAVTLVPFTTGLLAEYTTLRSAFFVYWLNIFVLGAVLYRSIRYAKRAGLLRAEEFDASRTPHESRIFSAQTLYLIGLALSAINTYWSIVFVLLVQLYFVFAPQSRFSDQLGRWWADWVGAILNDQKIRSEAAATDSEHDPIQNDRPPSESAPRPD